MNKTTKKVFLIILAITFVLVNIIHIYWPIHLILEDIKNQSMAGTNMDLMVLYPWLIEILSIPLILTEIIILIIFSKVKYNNVFNLIAFSFYIFQVLLFNILLSF